MAITIPELNSVSVVDDTDNIMLTHSNGNSEKISGAALKADMIKDKIENNNGAAVSVNAVSTILATGTTITGPALGTGGNIKILFTAAISGSDTSTGLSLTYNGDAISVKVGKDGSLEDFCAVEVSSGTYRYLQAYTTLELVFDGTYFIIVGSPIVLSGSNYKIHADGNHAVDVVASNNMNSVTSNAVFYKLENNIIHGPSITVPVDLSSTGLKFADFTPAPYEYKNKYLKTYIIRSSTYRVCGIGVGSDRLYYQVSTSMSGAFSLDVIPLYGD